MLFKKHKYVLGLDVNSKILTEDKKLNFNNVDLI